MKGAIIIYKAKDSNARTLLNHTLFGRLMYKHRRGKNIAYYLGGILDNIKFKRLVTSKIFVDLPYEEVCKICNEQLGDTFGEINVEEAERDIAPEALKTGKEYWKSISEETEYVFHVCRKKKNDI